MAERARDRLGRPVPLDDPTAVDHGIDVDAPRDAAATLDVGQELLDRGLPFAAHEVFEARWKSCPADERDLWQGLAQWCVALTHDERGNATGASTLRARARTHLAAASTSGSAQRLSLDLGPLLQWLVEPTEPLPRVPG